MPLELEAVVVGLEASIQRAMNIAGKNAKIDLGTSSKAIDSLSQPLGRITGQADQFGKSMEAANARVLAFGASVGILGAVTRGFKEMISTTIQVEKSLADINSVLGANATQLNKFKNDIFSVAKETGNSFQTVSEAALELSRQGLKSDEVLRRLKDSMVLSRLSGMDAASSVEGLTAAVNSFSKSGITSTEVLNKIAKTAAAYSVSEKDLIEGMKRSASVADQAGVSINELGGIITAVQEKTARGGAVIGNAFKTIFTRIRNPESLQALQEVGVAVTNMQGGLLPATKLIEGLAQKMNSLNDIQKQNVTLKIGGGFQIGPLLAALDDLTSKTSTYRGATEAMATASNEAYQRNTALNITLDNAINNTTVSVQELANTLGEIGVTDSLKNILSFFSSLTTNIKDLLQGEGIGSDLAKGIVKGLSGIITGPGFVIFGAIIAKLTYGLVTFGTESLKAFFGIGQAQKEINALASSLTNTLMNNANIHKAVLSLEGNHVAQATLLGTILKQNNAEMQRFVEMGARLAPGVASVVKGGGRSAAGGYMPAVAQENSDIQRGVGGASPSNRPVVIPNFAFGGGKVGTMVANDGEYVVNNYGGSGGSAIFNKDMVSKIGLPSGAQKINSAGGFIPNFAATSGVWADDLARFQRGGVSRQQLSSRYGKDVVDAKIGSSVKSTSKSLSSTLNIDANALGGLGVVSVSGGQGNIDTSENRGQMSASEVDFLDKSFGKDKIQKVIMSNIQSRSLGVLDSTLKMNNQEAFRAKVKEKFTSPLVDMGSELIGRTFKGNDKADLVSQLSAKKNDPALFSESVLGGIFESAIRVATKSAKEIGAFKDVDANAAFDFEESGSADKEFKNAFGFGDNLYKADAKKTANQKTVQTIIGKALRDREVGSRIQSSYSSQVASQIAARGASGYIPNFANALNEAVSREVGAGVDPSQVYVDQNSSLKNSANPMGLMVANRRDEPSGGWQGIDRARKEGADVTAYGAARGFIPNYAAQPLSSFGGSDEPLTSSASLEKANKDYLGTIFAVQMAMSALTASTAGSTSSVGKFTNAVTEGLSSITTVIFAVQGLKSATSGMTAGLGGFASKAINTVAPIAVALTAYSVTMKTAQGLFVNSSNGAANSIDKMSSMAESASGSLSQLEKNIIKSTLASSTKEQASFSGFLGKIANNIGTTAIASMYTGENLSYSKHKNQNLLLSNVSEEQFQSAKESYVSTYVAANKGKNKNLSTEDQTKQAATEFEKILNLKEGGELQVISESSLNLLTAYTSGLVKQAEQNKGILSIAEEKTAVDQVNLNLAKLQLTNAIEYSLAQSRSLDSLDKRLISSKVLNNLSQEEVSNLDLLISKRDEDRKLSDDTSKILQDQINKLNGLAAAKQAQVSLQEEFNKLTDVELNDKGEILKFADKIQKVLAENVNLNEADKKILQENLDRLFNMNSLAKTKLDLNQKTTQELQKQQNIIESTAATMKAAASYKLFSSTMASDVGIQSKNLEVGRLEDSKRGKSDEEIRSIEKTIAARKLEITQLEGSKRTTESITQAKSILEGSLPEAVDKQSRQVFSSLANSVDDAISIATRNLNKAKPEEKAAYTSAIFELQKLKETTEFQNKSAIELAQQQAGMAGQTKAVNEALVLFKNSLEDIPQKLAALSLQRSTTTSGKQLREMDYEKETLSKVDKMNADGKTPEEIAAYQRERSVKGVGQKFSEAFSETEYDRANRFSDTLVSGAEKFRDTMIDGISKTIEEGGNLGDILSSAALDFAREMTKANMKNLFSSFMPSPRIGFASGGKITGGSGTKDDVPAMLMGGEYVMNKKSVSKYGTKFMEQLNNGTLSHFASGGKVDDSIIRSGGLGSSSQIMSSVPNQTGQGGFYMPGYYGAGSISGKQDLLNYATQSYTSGKNDIISGGSDYGSINLEGESARLTQFGRTSGPMAQAIAESKGQSFGLYKQQIEQEAAIEKARKDAIKARQSALKTALITAVVSAGVSAVGSAVGSGYNAASSAAKAGGATGMGQVGAGLKGIFTGGNIGGGIQAGGLKNLFSGNFGLSQVGNLKDYQNYLSNNPKIAQQILGSSDYKNISGPSGSLDINRNVLEAGVSNRPEFQNPYFEARGDVIPNIPRRATGGPIPQMAGTDTVPAMLSGGEFIMNQAATQRIGPANLNSMNSGADTSTKESSDLNEKLLIKLDELIKTTKENKPVTVNVSSSNPKNSDDSKEDKDSSQQDNNLSAKIKAAVIKVLQEEKRLGGVLRRSN